MFVTDAHAVTGFCDPVKRLEVRLPGAGKLPGLGAGEAPIEPRVLTATANVEDTIGIAAHPGAAVPMAEPSAAPYLATAANAVRPWAVPCAAVVEGYCPPAPPLAPPFWAPPPDLGPITPLPLPPCLGPFSQCRWV